MEEKVCTGCKESKPLDDFGMKSGKKNTRCKACVNKYYREIYYADPERKKYILGRNRENSRIAKERAIQVVLKSFELGCTDCGNKDVRVLEFDHLRDKEFNVGVLMNMNSHDRLIKEIEKCEVVCANCHKIRTYSRSDSWRNAAVYPLADNE